MPASVPFAFAIAHTTGRYCYYKVEVEEGCDLTLAVILQPKRSMMILMLTV